MARVGGKNLALVNRVEIERLDLFNRMRQSGRQRIVSPDYEPVRTIGLHEMTQHSATVRDYIEVELICVARRRPRNRRAALRHDPISHVESSDQRGQRAAGVIQDYSQVGMPLEHAAVNQQRRGEAGVVKIADQVAEKISAKRSSRRGFERMDANDHPRASAASQNTSNSGSSS